MPQALLGHACEEQIQLEGASIPHCASPHARWMVLKDARIFREMENRLTWRLMSRRASFSRSIALFRLAVCFAFFRFEKPVKYSLQRQHRIFVNRPVQTAQRAVVQARRELGLTFASLRRRQPP